MNLMKYFASTVFMVAIIGGLFFTSCESDNTDSNKGSLRVIMTDAPFPGDMVEEANVTITKIEIRNSGNYTEQEQNEGEDGEEDGQDNENPFVVVSEEEMSMNLLELRNGVTAQLAELEIPEGSYDLIRLYIGDASVKLTDGSTFNMEVPSGAKTGLKVFVEPAIEVAGGLTAELLLDFNVSESFVARGNLDSPAGISGFIFKPVIRATNNTTAGRIVGAVTDTAGAVGNAEVWVTRDSTVATTFTEESGDYALMGLPEGTYDLHATKADYDTVSVTGVEVVPGNSTEENISFPVE